MHEHLGRKNAPVFSAIIFDCFESDSVGHEKQGCGRFLFITHLNKCSILRLLTNLLRSHPVRWTCLRQQLQQTSSRREFYHTATAQLLQHTHFHTMAAAGTVARAPKTVLITGAAGQIGYAIVAMAAGGKMLGLQQPIILHLLDIEPAKQALEGVKMELLDAAFPLLIDVVTSTDAETACKGVDVAVMVGGFPRKAGMERMDVMAKNVSIYATQAQALEKYANKDVRILVVANPANTNALMLKEHAPGIPAENITAMTRLDHNRALAQVAQRAGVHVTNVRNVIIWGNHSSTQYPDVNHGTVDGKPIREVLKDSSDWLDKEFVDVVQQRGAAVIKARGLSSAMSAASSACDHIHDWVNGTPEGTWVSMGVYSDGSYGADAGLIYSFPCTCKDGKWSIVQDLTIDARSAEKLRVTDDELKEERALALECIGESAH